MTLQEKVVFFNQMHVLKHFQSRLKFNAHLFIFCHFMFAMRITFWEVETIRNPFMERENLKQILDRYNFRTVHSPFSK